jgi:ferredoxin-NADP reductase
MEVVVKEVRELSPGVREIVLAAPGGVSLPGYEPGAHIAVELALADGTKEARDYSLIGGTAEADDPAELYRIAVERKPDGKGGSNAIFAGCVPGTTLEITAPRNEFGLNTHQANRVFVAGGIGVTPIYAMLRRLARKQMPFAIHVVGPAIAYRAEIEKLSGGNAVFHADEEKFDPDPVIAALGYPAEVYVCGSWELNQKVVRVAQDHGLSNMQIMQQCFSPPPPKPNEAEGFEVELRRTGLTVYVPPDTSILESVLMSGYNARFYCGRGECGYCPLPVIESDGVIEHRDHFLSEEEKANDERMCICVSRLKKGTRIVLDA